MTYCLAIALKSGLVFLSDSRTNAGVDQVSTYSKMQTFGVDGERQFVLLSAGNLATTQAVTNQLRRDMSQGAPVSLLTVTHMSEAADYVGAVNRQQQEKNTGGGATYEATFILGGQIAGDPPMIFLIYPAGNHITTSPDTTYLQIGEFKYGKPILDRILTPDTPLETAAMCGLVSMDSTQRSNITVGPPFELLIYTRDSLLIPPRHRLEEGNTHLRELKKCWDESLRSAFQQLPSLTWLVSPDQPQVGVPVAQGVEYQS